MTALHERLQRKRMGTAPVCAKPRAPPPPSTTPTARRISAAQAREHVARYLPQVARNGTAADFVWIIADAAGRVVEFGDGNNSEALNRDVDGIDDVQVFKSKELVFSGHQVALVYARMKG